MPDDYYRDRRVAETYDAEQAGNPITTDDVPFYVELAREAAAAGQDVLDLACGTGRVTLPIADAGVPVVGLDSSAAMLAVARQKARDRANLRWLEAEMTSFQLDERFGLVIIPFRSFLMLLSVADQKACLKRVRAHLVPGGRLALNVFNPDPVIIAAARDAHSDTLRQLEPNGRRERWAARRYEIGEQTPDETWIEEELGDAGAVISRVYRNLRLRYVFRYEMEHLLTLCGFTVEALYGWFDRRPFTDASAEMVWLARVR